MTLSPRTAALAAALAAPLALTTALPAAAGPIESACLRSDRAAASRRLCGCVQEVADRTLRPADQRRAARFFADPDRAQDVRMSTSDRDNDFWDRYRRFGEAAAATCG